jgi:SAM-dependent methyltransferase
LAAKGFRRKVLSVSNQAERYDFDDLYRDERMADGLPAMTPWDIGGPQPVVQQLVAFGGVRGEVLDPGTGPGHHAIYFAQKGYAATGIDSSPVGIERARRNAQRAGVRVNFQVADATKLEGLENRFGTVVDSAFYHVHDEDVQGQYAQALHRATRPGARLYLFEAARHNVNGIQAHGLPAENFERILPAAGWRIDYLGPTAYRAHMTPEGFAEWLARACTSGWGERVKPLQEQLGVIGPLLENHLLHMPFWAVTATRQD